MKGSLRQRKKKAIGIHRQRIDPRMEVCPKCLEGTSGFGGIYEHGGNYYEYSVLTICQDCGLEARNYSQWFRFWRKRRHGRKLARKFLASCGWYGTIVRESPEWIAGQ